MNKNLRHLYELTVQSKLHNYNKTWAYDFDEYYVEIFTELMLKDIDKIINKLYHSLPADKAEVLNTLNQQIENHFYGDNDA